MSHAVTNILGATIDEMELAMSMHEQSDCPVEHRFVPGMYIRQMTLPAGTLATSMTHRFEHPFFILKGSIQIISENEGAVTYTAPYFGITQPGTRRMAYALEETIMIALHPTEETDIEKIEEAILEPHDNPLLETSGNEQWRLSLPPKQLTE